MNCALCYAYLREKNPCLGCNSDDENKPRSCIACSIVNCEKRHGRYKKFCLSCDDGPCRRLKQLDKRYRTKYGMSMLENLAHIHEHGIRAFVRREKERWKCPECGGVIVVHRENCIYCGTPRKYESFT